MRASQINRFIQFYSIDGFSPRGDSPDRRRSRDRSNKVPKAAHPTGFFFQFRKSQLQAQARPKFRSKIRDAAGLVKTYPL
jgi:hypothetical protein